MFGASRSLHFEPSPDSKIVDLVEDVLDPELEVRISSENSVENGFEVTDSLEI